MYRVKGPLIARPVAPEMMERGSDLSQLVTVAGDMRATRQEGADAIANKTRTLLHNSCSSYKQSRNKEAGVFCASGERDGVPVRPECTRCIVGQFSQSGLFVGELIPVEAISY